MIEQFIFICVGMCLVFAGMKFERHKEKRFLNMLIDKYESENYKETPNSLKILKYSYYHTRISKEFLKSRGIKIN